MVGKCIVSLVELSLNHDPFGPGCFDQEMSYLEGQSGPNFVRQDFSDNLVKGPEDFHCQLGFDTAFVDQVVEGIGEG